MMELHPSVKSEFRDQALRDSPREACGLVSIIKGKQHYHECKNISEDDRDFLLDPHDYVRTDDFVTEHAGEIVAVLHSHPYSTAIPSMADKAGCEASGLVWFIHSLKSENWFEMSPTGYKAPLIGRPFKHGIFDCYSAMRDWYGENLGIELLDFYREEKWWEKGQDLFMENFHKAGFKEVREGEILRGDVLLMNIASSVVNHCAVYIGNDQVFHQTMNRLSSREIYGGLLKKNTRLVLRHTR